MTALEQVLSAAVSLGPGEAIKRHGAGLSGVERRLVLELSPGEFKELSSMTHQLVVCLANS